MAALAPLAILVWNFTQGELGVDPVNTINNWTGRTAIVLLLVCLACTPANTIFGFRRALGVRKALGLYAFLYACLHLLNFIGLDYAFDFSLLWQDALLDKPYILVGALALLILLPLAVTSTRGWMKRLGRNWKRLHRLVYVAGVLAVLHFLWQAKVAERIDPLLYGLVLALLIARACASSSPLDRQDAHKVGRTQVESDSHTSWRHGRDASRQARPRCKARSATAWPVRQWSPTDRPLIRGNNKKGAAEQRLSCCCQSSCLCEAQPGIKIVRRCRHSPLATRHLQVREPIRL